MNTIFSQVDKTPVISLTDSEFTKVKDAAKKITSRKQARGSATWYHHYDDNDVLPTLMAFVAEKCFEKATGINVNLSYHHKGDKGIDARFKETDIQIKTANIANIKTPNLLVRKDHANADIYILSAWDYVTPKDTRFLGYASRDELVKTDCSFCKTPSYVVYQRHLRPVGELEFFGGDETPKAISGDLLSMIEIEAEQKAEAAYKARIRRELGNAYRKYVLKEPPIGEVDTERIIV